MTHPLIRNVLMLLASGALGAYASSAAADGLRPNFPIRLPEAAQPPAADAPVATAPDAVRPEPAKAEPARPALRLTPIGVESRPLAPVAQRPAPAAVHRPALAAVQRAPSDFRVDEWPAEPRAGLIRVASHRKAPAHKAAARPADEEPEAPATYTVRKGDTLDKIAGKLGVSVAELKKLNGLKGSAIHPGQRLKGPAPAGGAAKASSKKDNAKKETARKEAAKPETYTVRKGDTLFSIAKRTGVGVDDLRAANGLKAKGAIHAGQKLKLGVAAAEEPPAEEAPAPRHGKATARPDRAEEPSVVEEAARGGRTISTRSVTGHVVEVPGGASSYRVKKGDTIGEVADNLGVSVAQLKKANRLKSNTIRKGQVLKGPKSTAHAYVAASGDTIAGVAKRFSVTPEALRAANGLKKSVLVARPGQKLRLPAGYRDRGAVTVTTRVPAPASEPAPAYAPPPREAPSPALPSRPQPYTGGSRYSPPPVAAAAPVTSDAQISQLGRGRFVWPVQGETISAFGAKPGGTRNDGINIRASTGDPVRVAATGDVVYAGDQVPGFGNLVLVKHPDGWVTAYGHLSRIDVKMQQKVSQGQQIGLAGATGGVAEPQLHFEIRYGAAGERARPIDPALVLPK